MWLLGKFSIGAIKVYLATLFWCQCHNFNCANVCSNICQEKTSTAAPLFISKRINFRSFFWSNYKNTYHFASMFYFYYLHHIIKGLILPYITTFSLRNLNRLFLNLMKWFPASPGSRWAHQSKVCTGRYETTYITNAAATAPVTLFRELPKRDKDVQKNISTSMLENWKQQKSKDRVLNELQLSYYKITCFDSATMKLWVKYVSSIEEGWSTELVETYIWMDGESQQFIAEVMVWKGEGDAYPRLSEEAEGEAPDSLPPQLWPRRSDSTDVRCIRMKGLDLLCCQICVSVWLYIWSVQEGNVLNV